MIWVWWSWFRSLTRWNLGATTSLPRWPPRFVDSRFKLILTSMLIIGNTKLTHICSGDHQLNNCISSYVLFCSFSQVLLQMKKLETKMATMTEEKDKRISELQVCKDQDVRYLSWTMIFWYYFKWTYLIAGAQQRPLQQVGGVWGEIQQPAGRVKVTLF